MRSSDLNGKSFASFIPLPETHQLNLKQKMESASYLKASEDVPAKVITNLSGDIDISFYFQNDLYSIAYTLMI